jgi:hypothetical protein
MVFMIEEKARGLNWKQVLERKPWRPADGIMKIQVEYYSCMVP